MALIIVVIWFFFSSWEIQHPPGVLIDMEPSQAPCGSSRLLEVAGYTLTPLASYHLTARVLHKKRYFSGTAALVPYDVALGWGRMSDTAVLSNLVISQGNRFYFYEWRHRAPIPQGEIIAHSANNHLIAADSNIAGFIRSLRVGHLVDLRGYLVEARKDNGFIWRSSLSRVDSGNGACELFYVTNARFFDGHPLAEAEATPVPRALAEPTPVRSMQDWHRDLEARRRSLNAGDAKAVQAFNDEVLQYMKANRNPGTSPVRDGSAPATMAATPRATP